MFTKLKRDFLEKKDKSKIGEIDKNILDLVNKINDSEDYFTTSSCSGRIVLATGEEKKEWRWIKVSHDLVDLEWMKDIELPSELMWLRMEPMILHAACRNIEKAQELLDKVQPIFKKSSIQTTKSKVLVEIKGSEYVVAPVARGNWLVSDGYLKVLIEEVNKKLKRTRENTKRLQSFVPF